MTERNLELTTIDSIILESYCSMLDGLSNYFGSGYEIVLHSLEDYSHSAIKVINGFHTGREVGAPITNLALERLQKIEESSDDSAVLTYFTRNKAGEPMKSTTIPVRGEQGRIIGLLCINFYLNTPFAQFIEEYLPGDGQAMTVEAEKFSSSSSDMIDEMIESVHAEVLRDSTIPSTNKNREIVTRLHARGIYSMKDAVATTARVLGISKNTVYLHLRNVDK